MTYDRVILLSRVHEQHMRDLTQARASSVQAHRDLMEQRLGVTSDTNMDFITQVGLNVPVQYPQCRTHLLSKGLFVRMVSALLRSLTATAIADFQFLLDAIELLPTQPRFLQARHLVEFGFQQLGHVAAYLPFVISKLLRPGQFRAQAKVFYASLHGTHDLKITISHIIRAFSQFAAMHVTLSREKYTAGSGIDVMEDSIELFVASAVTAFGAHEMRVANFGNLWQFPQTAEYLGSNSRDTMISETLHLEGKRVSSNGKNLLEDVSRRLARLEFKREVAFASPDSAIAAQVGAQFAAELRQPAGTLRRVLGIPLDGGGHDAHVELQPMHVVQFLNHDVYTLVGAQRAGLRTAMRRVGDPSAGLPAGAPMLYKLVSKLMVERLCGKRRTSLRPGQDVSIFVPAEELARERVAYPVCPTWPRLARVVSILQVNVDDTDSFWVEVSRYHYARDESNSGIVGCPVVRSLPGAFFVPISHILDFVCLHHACDLDMSASGNINPQFCVMAADVPDADLEATRQKRRMIHGAGPLFWYNAFVSDLLPQ